jgi:hypothetical protein
VTVIQITSNSISAKQFARGTLVFYTLTFGALLLFVVTFVVALLDTVIILSERSKSGAQVGPGIMYLVFWAVTLIGLILAGGIAAFFWWGVKCILRQKAAGTVVFLTVLAGLHAAWFARVGFQFGTFNWLGGSVCIISWAYALVRRSHLPT